MCKHGFGVALYPLPKVGGFMATEDKEETRRLLAARDTGGLRLSIMGYNKAFWGKIQWVPRIKPKPLFSPL